MSNPRTTLVEFTEPYRVLGSRYNRGDVMRLPRRLASTLVSNRIAVVASEGRLETGSTVADLHESSRRGLRGSASSRHPIRETKADGIPERKETAAESPVTASSQSDEPSVESFDTTVEDVIQGLKSMTVVQLREACRGNGISSEGKKARLVARLSGHLRRESASESIRED